MLFLGIRDKREKKNILHISLSEYCLEGQTSLKKKGNSEKFQILEAGEIEQQMDL